MRTTDRRLDRLAAALAPPDLADVRKSAARVAAAVGLPAAAVLAEAERIVRSGAGGVPFDPTRMVEEVAGHHGLPSWQVAAEVERVAAEVER